MSATKKIMRCDCCGGDLPPRKIWEANRDNADDCDGSVHMPTLRCRAFRRDELWEVEEETSPCYHCGRDFSVADMHRDCDGDYVCDACHGKRL